MSCCNICKICEWWWDSRNFFLSYCKEQTETSKGQDVFNVFPLICKQRICFGGTVLTFAHLGLGGGPSSTINAAPHASWGRCWAEETGQQERSGAQGLLFINKPPCSVSMALSSAGESRWSSGSSAVHMFLKKWSVSGVLGRLNHQSTCVLRCGHDREFFWKEVADWWIRTFTA